MPKNEDLHGIVPDSCPVVLLLVDVLNDVDFPGNEQLLKSIASLGKNIARLKKRCKGTRIPAIYVNDNHDKWRSDVSAVLSHCLHRDSPGCPMVSQSIPEASDYIVKAETFRFLCNATGYAFFVSESKNINSGWLNHQCVHFIDCHGIVRSRSGRLVYVPSDCAAAPIKRAHNYALELMKISFNADTTSSTRLNLRKILKTARG